MLRSNLLSVFSKSLPVPDSSYSELSPMLAAFPLTTEVTLEHDTGRATVPPHNNANKTRHSPYSAFLNGFHGFCSVFVTASFAFNGTELTGLAAAEADDPRKEIPRATKQVVYRISFFYLLTLFLIGLNVPANSPLYTGEGSSSRHSPFVIAIELAGIKALPSIFNAVILISVMSVANSCTFGSTRTFQALAQNGIYKPNRI